MCERLVRFEGAGRVFFYLFERAIGFWEGKTITDMLGYPHPPIPNRMYEWSV